MERETPAAYAARRAAETRRPYATYSVPDAPEWVYAAPYCAFNVAAYARPCIGATVVEVYRHA